MTWEYIAGFFDGEGNIHCSTGTIGNCGGNVQLSIYQAGDRGLRALTAIKGFIEVNGIECTIYKRDIREGQNQIGYQLFLGKWEMIEKLLNKLFPHLYIKKVEAQDVLRFKKLYPSIRRGALLSSAIRDGKRRSMRAN